MQSMRSSSRESGGFWWRAGWHPLCRASESHSESLHHLPKSSIPRDLMGNFSLVLSSELNGLSKYPVSRNLSETAQSVFPVVF